MYRLKARPLFVAVALAIGPPIVMQAAVNVGSSAWTWQNPLPQGNALNSVSCPTTTVCFAMGDLGTILRRVSLPPRYEFEPLLTARAR